MQSIELTFGFCEDFIASITLRRHLSFCETAAVDTAASYKVVDCAEIFLDENNTGEISLEPIRMRKLDMELLATGVPSVHLLQKAQKILEMQGFEMTTDEAIKNAICEESSKNEDRGDGPFMVYRIMDKGI